MKSWIQRCASLVALCTIAGPLAALTDPRPVVRVAVQQVSTSGTLTALREQSNVGSRSFPMIFSPLIELDRQGDLAPVPGLATSWKRIDERTVELKLRKGARFHNGDEVTADDVAFTFGPEHMFGATKPFRVGDAPATARGADGKALFTSATKVLGPTPPPEVPESVPGP